MTRHDVNHIPMPEGRGFTASLIKFHFHPERSGHNTLHQICNNLEAFVDELVAKKLTEQKEVQP